ncbi:MAG: hypothetical protein FJZ47_22965 [Candidatus Tectomicrobia bacterium]|uniref:Uncharacterized protein n=1 Tax=Tectimicrobiota bacterium TaxID=2528274 RepID=A0A938B4M8_UNCTE|nr:hypothetical protein [Candidatus Tectomicrobia bacterium]
MPSIASTAAASPPGGETGRPGVTGVRDRRAGGLNGRDQGTITVLLGDAEAMGDDPGIVHELLHMAQGVRTIACVTE